jgi:NAD(P)-dependent dehydrogenase (short-subunit alcohol dehydrogenase family)
MTSLPEPTHPFALFSLSQRVAVVTGGAGLLGTEFCRTLAAAGAQVVVADINAGAAKAVAESLQQAGNAALAIHTDVTAPASVQAMVTATLQAFGRLDILVNSAVQDPKFDPESINASLTTSNTNPDHQSLITNYYSFEDYPIEAWNQALNVNLTGAFLCSQAAARPMLEQGSGVIINLSSIYGLTGPDQRLYLRPMYKPVYYSVTKAGILGLTLYLATYYAGKNIRVNALTPGGVFNGHDDDFIQAYSARTVLGRMAEKTDMNGALLFLASDASSYMTGANLVVDGGWTAW